MANTCGLINLSSEETCSEASGGLAKSAVIGCEDVSAITLDTDGQVTAITMATTNLFALQEFDDDNSSKYTQTGTRDNKKFEVQQEASYKFAGLDESKMLFSRALSQCCCLYAIHWYNNGTVVLQGIDVKEDPATPGTYIWEKTKQKCVADMDQDTDTGENEDRLDIKLNSLGRNFSPRIDMTEENLLALIQPAA